MICSSLRGYILGLMLAAMRFVIVVALLVACTKASEEKPQPVKSNDGTELLTTGRGEQRALRYKLVKGTKAKLELSMSNAISAGNRDMKMPALVITLELVVEDVKPDGTANIKTTIVAATMREVPGATVPVGVVAEMATSLSGTVFTATLSPTGRVIDPKVVPTKNVPTPVRAQIEQLNQQISQVAIPLPEVPVGVGAKWSVKSDTDLDGIKLVTVTTTEVVKLEGEVVTFASATTITAPDQKVRNGDVQAELKDIGGGGSSKGVVDLARMTMDGEMSLEFRGTMSAQGLTAPLKMAMTMSTKPVL